MQTSMKAAHFNLSKWSHEDAMKSHSLGYPEVCIILIAKLFSVLNPGENTLPSSDNTNKKKKKK